MRVLHVNKFLYRRGGAEGYMLDVAALQAADGHEVAFWGTDENAGVGPLSDTFPRYLSLDPPPPSAADKARAVTRMMWNREAEKGIAAAVERFRPDVAHLHNIYHQLSPAILRPLRRKGVPVVLTLHDYKLACPTYQFLDKGTVCEACIGGGFRQAVRRRCRNDSLLSSSLMAVELGLHTRLGSYDAVDAFVCPSRFMARKMTEAGVFPERMRHLPHPVELPAEAKTQAGGGIFFAGRLSHEKGVDVLLEALARVKDPETRLTIAGEGPELEALQRLALKLVPERVTFAGRLSKDDVLAGIRAAATVVVPSRWYENQPLAVLEAMGCGVPVIGTDLGGIPELIEDGRTGWLVPPDDPVELALAIDEALADPAATLARGSAARDQVANNFSVRSHLGGLESLYDEARHRAGRTEEATCG